MIVSDAARSRPAAHRLSVRGSAQFASSPAPKDDGVNGSIPPLATSTELMSRAQVTAGMSPLSLSEEVIQRSASRGRSLNSAATASVTVPKSRQRGRYRRSSPLVFSFVPRGQGECGSQMPSRWAAPAGRRCPHDCVLRSHRARAPHARRPSTALRLEHDTVVVQQAVAEQPLPKRGRMISATIISRLLRGTPTSGHISQAVLRSEQPPRAWLHRHLGVSSHNWTTRLAATTATSSTVPPRLRRSTSPSQPLIPVAAVPTDATVGDSALPMFPPAV